MTSRAVPVRTCVGCRERAVKSDLLRVVAVEGVLVPDPRGRMPGRGAHVHPSRSCLDLAERRRAFRRALRLPGAPDLAPVRAHVAQQDVQGTTKPEAGRDAVDRSMSTQR